MKIDNQIPVSASALRNRSFVRLTGLFTVTPRSCPISFLVIGLIFVFAALAAPPAVAMPPFSPEHEPIKNAYNSNDFARAFELARPLAEAGDPFAAYVMGRLHHPAFKGEEIKKDAKLAISYLMKAAKGGSGEAAMMAGDIFEEGYGYQKDPAEAFKWYAKSASMGFVGGAGAMGRLYKAGSGVSKDLTKAFECFLLDANLGNIEAQTNLAIVLIKGEGTAADPAAGLKWVVRAAESGQKLAQQILGQAYEAGDLGVGRDMVEAFKYLALSAQSNPAAKASLDRVKRSMNRSQIRQAEREAAKWSRKTPWSDPAAVARAGRIAAEAQKAGRAWRESVQVAKAPGATGDSDSARRPVTGAGKVHRTTKESKKPAKSSVSGPKPKKPAASASMDGNDIPDDFTTWPADDGIMSTEEVEKAILDGYY